MAIDLPVASPRAAASPSEYGIATPIKNRNRGKIRSMKRILPFDVVHLRGEPVQRRQVTGRRQRLDHRRAANDPKHVKTTQRIHGHDVRVEFAAVAALVADAFSRPGFPAVRASRLPCGVFAALLILHSCCGSAVSRRHSIFRKTSSASSTTSSLHADGFPRYTFPKSLETPTDLKRTVANAGSTDRADPSCTKLRSDGAVRHTAFRVHLQDSTAVERMTFHANPA